MEKKRKSVEVKIELGHRAVMKEKSSPEGFTHDWTIFVRGVEGNNIQFFVEKVVFHLHESFPKPKRVVKEPPYSVSESGYAGFIMPIDVYFRSREEPKKVTFKYDLYLRLESSPVNNIRIEKLTFNNPSDDFRSKLIRAGGIANTTGSASGGSASLSTQACIPPPHIIEDQPPVVQPPKPVVAEKKPRPHVPSKEIKPQTSSQPPPPKPSQPFTDIFGAPIRTKKSPSETSSVKSKEPGHSSQVKSKSSLNSSSSSSSSKESKSSSKESHKLKDNHHSSKESRHLSKENHHSSKESHLAKETHHTSKEASQEKSIVHSSKDPVPLKESHHSTKETHHKPKEHHSKEGHKKEGHHSSKETKPPKDNRPSDSKDLKPPKPLKLDKESTKSSVKRAAPSDSHDSHGIPEKKKKLSPAPSESTDKSSSHSKHKIKESKDKAPKQKVKPHSNSVKKEEEKFKHKSSPAPPLEVAEPKEMPKPPKPFSPKPPSTPPLPPPPPIVKQPLPKSPPTPSSPSSSSDSDDESHKSSYNKAHYSSPASSISESSLHSNIPVLSDRSIISPLSDDDDDDDDFSPPAPPKRKVSNDYDLDERSQEPKPVENKSVQKLKKSHHKPSKHRSESFQGNGSVHSDVSMQHSPSPEGQSNSTNNSINNISSYAEELVEIQQKLMSSTDRKLLQNIVDVIEATGKFEITNTSFEFDLSSLDRAIVQKIKFFLMNCDKC